MGACFPSRCNVVVGNALVLMLEGKLWALAFSHGEMFFLVMLLCSCYKESERTLSFPHNEMLL
jgi:hypothetical protein